MFAQIYFTISLMVVALKFGLVANFQNPEIVASRESRLQLSAFTYFTGGVCQVPSPMRLSAGFRARNEVFIFFAPSPLAETSIAYEESR